MMRTGMPSANQAIHKGIEGEDWEDLYCHCREMSRAPGAKKPSESRKAKALWAMKAPRTGREEYCDPARKEDILVRRKRHDWSCGKSISKTKS